MKQSIFLSLTVLLTVTLTTSKKHEKESSESMESLPDLSSDDSDDFDDDENGDVVNDENDEDNHEKKHEKKKPNKLKKEKKLTKLLDFRGELRKKFALTAASINPKLSLVCSPLSALLPLGMLAFGADGKTLKELLKALGAKKKAELRDQFKFLLHGLKDLEGAYLSVASRIYMSVEKKLRSSFMEETESIFKSTIELVDMKDPVHVATTVNYWVQRETRGFINEMLQPKDVTSDASLILVNAVYFSGKWLKPFDSTTYEKFYSPTGERTVPMMRVEGHFKYGNSKTLGAEIVEIPYREKESSLLVILPSEKTGLTLLLNQLKLAPELINSVTLKKQRVKIYLPRFKIESQIDLTDIYQKIGLTEMFTRSSGLRGIVRDESVFVSKAIHKAVIEVTEKGTKAAAASAVKLQPLSLVVVPVFEANHPFLFFVTSKGQQIFAGVVNEVKKAPKSVESLRLKLKKGEKIISRKEYVVFCTGRNIKVLEKTVVVAEDGDGVCYVVDSALNIQVPHPFESIHQLATYLDTKPCSEESLVYMNLFFFNVTCYEALEKYILRLDIEKDHKTVKSTVTHDF